MHFWWIGIMIDSRYCLLCYIYTNEPNGETCMTSNRYECDKIGRVDVFAKLRWGRDFRRHSKERKKKTTTKQEKIAWHFNYAANCKQINDDID